MKAAIIIFLSLIFITAVHAETTGLVNGYVYSSLDDSTPVDGITVHVTCYDDNQGQTFLEEKTNVTGTPFPGYYRVTFSNCGEGDYAQTCAGTLCSDFSILEIRNSHIATAQNDLFGLQPDVPEFGLIGAGLAIAGAITGIVLFRKR